MNTAGIGFKSVMRDSSTDIRVQNGNTLYSGTQANNGFPTLEYWLLRTANIYSDAGISCYWIGASITNTQIANFRTYYNTFLVSNGLTAVA